MCVVALLAREAGVDHVTDAGNGDGRFGDVGGDDQFARVGRNGVKRPHLLLGGERGVERKHDERGN